VPRRDTFGGTSVDNFEYFNPTHIVFGKGAIARLSSLLPHDGRILMTYGGGSIKQNGVYDQTLAALRGFDVAEFGGVEPNPRYETLMKAVELARRQDTRFLLSVGGGSVLDGTKFIAAAMRFRGDEPWDILGKHARIEDAVPLGAILTLPATGSESNGNAVISRGATREKLAFYSEKVYPRFSILDPETTFTLPQRQTANGVVDAFIHVMEQYMTYPVNAPLQDRQAEAVLLTLIEEGPKVMANPADYDARANIMWTATQALNGLISCGVPQDWSTHGIGHELTALYGLDHAQTLAVVFPAVMRHQRKPKAGKILHYAERVWGIVDGSPGARIDAAIQKTEEFFRSLGVKTRLKEYGITEGYAEVAKRIAARGTALGEHDDIGPAEVDAILALCAA